MMNNPLPIRDYLVPGKRAHLVGIGGVSMCPLAEVLRGMGLRIQGSDMSEGPPSSTSSPWASPFTWATAPRTWGTATS